MTTYTLTDADGRIIEQTIDHGDGTGTRTLYGPDGQPAEVEELADSGDRFGAGVVLRREGKSGELLSPSGPTRRAIEALLDAITTTDPT